jgi:lysophospholipid acyltransferase (LPLAT)-like uncharacterized protein
MIPKPFSRVNVVYTPPTSVDAPSSREAESQAPTFDALLGEALAAAERG